MGSIDIIKCLSTVLKEHLEKNSWEYRELNPGLQGEKQVCYLCAMQPPTSLKLYHNAKRGVLSFFQSLVCLNGDIIRKETIQQMPPGNAKFLMDSVFELAQRINHFRLSDAEIGLFCAIVIITAGWNHQLLFLTMR